MTTRRTLGPGPKAAPIQAAEADLLTDLPGIDLPDVTELRARGVLDPHPAPAPRARRTLGTGTGTAPVARHALPYAVPGPQCVCQRHACGGLTPADRCSEHSRAAEPAMEWHPEGGVRCTQLAPDR
ncbi:hypothetical protein ABZ135_38700 [Streptomyces sp. NPDC006339]|uniref:hypothetical protein n=1 Tax=Streptomyces sp. NPDC006339 TaxID=3156755 RepID=UPI0033A0BAA8